MYSTKSDILNYCTEQQLAQLTSEVGDTIDDAVVTKVITDADAEIDSYLGTRYSVPLSPTPAMVNRLSSQMALYNLYTRRAGQIGMNETVETNYNNAIKFLQQAARGDVSIGVEPPPAKTTAGGAAFNYNERTFNKENLNGY
jgi:phage gp36-like protein